MDQIKTGEYIRLLRTEHGMTQAELAKKLCVSDKTVSKWECGAGSPDISMFPKLSEMFGINMQSLFCGEALKNKQINGNTKGIGFYICPGCKNIVFQFGKAEITCCGKILNPLIPKNALGLERLKISRVENDIFITAPHEMTRSHYISFTAFVSGDTVLMKKHFPEWTFETRIPYFAKVTLFWYDTKDGFFCQRI